MMSLTSFAPRLVSSSPDKRGDAHRNILKALRSPVAVTMISVSPESVEDSEPTTVCPMAGLLAVAASPMQVTAAQTNGTNVRRISRSPYFCVDDSDMFSVFERRPSWQTELIRKTAADTESNDGSHISLESDQHASLQQDLPPQGRQRILILDDRQKVVAFQFPRDAAEAVAAVGKQYLGLADSAGVKKDFARSRLARRVFGEERRDRTSLRGSSTLRRSNGHE